MRDLRCAGLLLCSLWLVGCGGKAIIDPLGGGGSGGGITTGSSSGSTPEMGAAQCSDGLDNDEDGSTDCCDTGCAGETVCQGDGGPEDNDATCSDCIDNDVNGYPDCQDFACMNPGVTVCP